MDGGIATFLVSILAAIVLAVLIKIIVTREKRTGQVAPQEIYRSKHLEESPSSDKQWSQGRLAHEQISTSTNTPTTDSQGGFHYVHEFIRASTVTEKENILGLGVPQEIATPYPSDEVEAHLNKRGQEGWNLISMEPHWWHERQAISLAMSITRPLAVVGWYLTFSRMAVTDDS